MLTSSPKGTKGDHVYTGSIQVSVVDVVFGGEEVDVGRVAGNRSVRGEDHELVVHGNAGPTIVGSHVEGIFKRCASVEGQAEVCPLRASEHLFPRSGDVAFGLGEKRPGEKQHASIGRKQRQVLVLVPADFGNGRSSGRPACMLYWFRNVNSGRVDSTSRRRRMRVTIPARTGRPGTRPMLLRTVVHVRHLAPRR